MSISTHGFEDLLVRDVVLLECVFVFVVFVFFEIGLPSTRQHSVPHPSFRVDQSLFLDNHRDGKVYAVRVYVTDGDSGKAGKRAVDCVLTQDVTHDRIVRVGDATANHVRWIDIFYVAFRFFFDFFAQPRSNITKERVSACVRARDFYELLPGAFRDDEDAVALLV